LLATRPHFLGVQKNGKHRRELGGGMNLRGRIIDCWMVEVPERARSTSHLCG